MEEALLLLEERPGDDELLGQIFRVMHMLKGNAAALEFTEISGCRTFDRRPAGLDSEPREISIDKEIVNLLLQAVDAIAQDGSGGGGRWRNLFACSPQLIDAFPRDYWARAETVSRTVG